MNTLKKAHDREAFYVRRGADRGHARISWLNSYHTFSFGEYYDPKHMSFGNLRVINDDTVSPGGGFDMHGHRDMEIISYVLEGEVSHEDSMGNSYKIPAGDVQVMSAGTGVVHSEFNHSEDPAHFLQIWITPAETDLKPNYDQKTIAHRPGLTPLVTGDGRADTLKINQAATINALHLEAGESLNLDPEHLGYLHLIEGSLNLMSSTGEHIDLMPGDGVGFDQKVVAAAEEAVHGLFFELPRK